MDIEPENQDDGAAIAESNFHQYLRKATRDVHTTSDVLVNAKFAFALNDDLVWADGILVFYEIYKYFEANAPAELIPNELRRTEAIEKDLNFFLGPDWKQNYSPRAEVLEYLLHLEEVKNHNPVLLYAYAHQMYMALMSGGQLLQKKRQIARKLNPFREPEVLMKEGCAITTFPGFEISEMKEKLRTILQNLEKNFDEKTRDEFVNESRNVFIYNNKVIRSVRGVGRVYVKRIGLAIIAIVLTVAFIKRFPKFI